MFFAWGGAVVQHPAPAKVCPGKELLGRSQGLSLLFIPSWAGGNKRFETQTTQEFIANRAHSPIVREMKLYLHAVRKVQSSFCIIVQITLRMGTQSKQQAQEFPVYYPGEQP